MTATAGKVGWQAGENPCEDAVACLPELLGCFLDVTAHQD
jgi:hypothetical protein